MTTTHDHKCRVLSRENTPWIPSKQFQPDNEGIKKDAFVKNYWRLVDYKNKKLIFEKRAAKSRKEICLVEKQKQDFQIKINESKEAGEELLFFSDGRVINQTRIRRLA